MMYLSSTKPAGARVFQFLSMVVVSSVARPGAFFSEAAGRCFVECD
jgi:hypothetical protein